jgi:aspartate ammonia-lyase
MAPHIGYDAATELAKEVAETGKSVREAALEMSLMTEAQLDAVLNPWEMTKPGISGQKFMSGKTQP